MKIINKKGSSHLEMVAAFTLFILFTIFLLSTLKAPENKTITNTILDNLEKNFIENNSVELASFLVTPNESLCVSLDLSNYSLAGNSSVFTYKGAIIGYDVSGSPFYVDDGKRLSHFENNILTINASGLNISKNESLKVYISEGINQTSSACSPVNGTLTLGNIKREMVLSEIKLREFEINYSNNYEALKSELKIPEGIEFSVVVVGLISAERNIPQGIDQFSKESVLDVMLANGSVTKTKAVFTRW